MYLYINIIEVANSLKTYAETMGPVKIIIVFLCTTSVLASELEIFEEKLRAVHKSLSNEIVALRGDIYINMLPEIERLKKNQCSCSDKTRDDSGGDETYIQKIDARVTAFRKAFSSEKMARKAMAVNIDALDETLEETQRKYTDMIETIKVLLGQNDAYTLNNTRDIKVLELAVRSIENAERNLALEIANISQRVKSALTKPLGGIRLPSFISQWFPMASQNPSLAERLIEHGLKELPVKVDVQIKSTSSSDDELIFPGDCVFQSDDDVSDVYSGVVYLYNETHVQLKAPNKSNNKQSGILVSTGIEKDRFAQNSTYRFSNGLVRVRAWLRKDFPSPTYSSDWLPLDTGDLKKSFYELSHGLSGYPGMVSVQIRLPSGFVSEGMGAVMSSFHWSSNVGGVLYGYDDKCLRIWTTYDSKEFQDQFGGGCGGLVGMADGWGVGGTPKNMVGHVKATVWAADSFTPYKNLHKFVANIDKNQITSLPIDVDTYLFNFHVQALDGANRGFLFKGYGSTQAQNAPFGGAIYAYNKKGQIKVWRPNEDKNGYLVHIKQPYGNGKYNQASNTAAYHVTILSPES